MTTTARGQKPPRYVRPAIDALEEDQLKDPQILSHLTFLRDADRNLSPEARAEIDQILSASGK